MAVAGSGHRRGWTAVLVLLLGALLAPRCRPTPPPPLVLHGIHVAPTVVHEGEQAAAFVSTLHDPVQLRVVDLVSGATVLTDDVPGAAQATYAYPWLAAGWTRSEPLPALAPGIYTVAIPTSALPPDEVSFSGGLNFEAPLLVRPAAPAAEVLLVFDDASWQAYNRFGGYSYYTSAPATTVGRRRSGWNRETVFLARIARELDALGVSWEVADTDYVEEHPGLLDDYRLVVLARKFEYMSRPFREALDDYFTAGGRVLAIGVEFATFQARREGDLWTCFKFTTRGTDPVLLDSDPGNDHLASYEWATVGEPETRLFGTSYWLGGWPGVASAWTVHRSAHWLWSGTGLAEGAPLTQVAPYDLIDGTLLEFSGGLPYVDAGEPTETPADFLVLASVATVNASPWWCWLEGTPKNQCYRPGWGVIGIRQNAAGGVLLVLPDAKWLADEKWLADPRVPQITRNALQVLASPGAVDAYAGYAP
jgi:hypothetical protein